MSDRIYKLLQPEMLTCMFPRYFELPEYVGSDQGTSSGKPG